MTKLVHFCVIYLFVASMKYQATCQIYAWAGENVTLVCHTYDSPRRGQWRRGHGTSWTVYTDNDEVTPNVQHKLNISVNVQKHEYNLHIYKVTPDDTDVYTCITEKDGDAFYFNVTLNVSEIKEKKTGDATITSAFENTSFITTEEPDHTTVLKRRFQLKILYLSGGIIGTVVLIMLCASLLIFFVYKRRKTTKTSLDFHHGTSSNTNSQQNPYDEIDEESSIVTRREDKENCPSSYLNVLQQDSLQSANNTYELIEIIPGVEIAVSSDVCAKEVQKRDLQLNEYHMYEEVTDENINQFKQLTCKRSVKEIKYNNSYNQGNGCSRMTNEIYRNTYQALQPNWQTPPKLYSRLTRDDL